MQTQAPHNDRPQLRQPPLHLYQMLPGMLFRVCEGADAPRAARLGALALMTHGGATVSDNTKIWCTVIAANAGDGVIGEFLSLPRDTPVERLHIVGLHLAREH